MRKRGGIALSLAVLASAGARLGRRRRLVGDRGLARRSSCKGTFKIAVAHPVTGRRRLPRPGAGARGRSCAVKTLAPKLGLKVQLLVGDTHARHGARPAQSLAQKYVADQQGRGDHRPGDVRCCSRHEPDVLRREAGAHLAVGHADASLTKGGNKPKTATTAFFRVVAGRLRPGRRVTPGTWSSKLNAKKVVALRCPGAVLGRPREHGRGGAEGEGVTTMQRVSVTIEQTDFSSIVTKIAERHGLSCSRRSSSRERADDRAAAPGAGQAGGRVRR